MRRDVVFVCTSGGPLHDDEAVRSRCRATRSALMPATYSRHCVRSDNWRIKRNAHSRQMAVRRSEPAATRRHLANRPASRCQAPGGWLVRVLLRWGFPPAKPNGPPIISFRSEGVFLSDAASCPRRTSLSSLARSRRSQNGSSRRPEKTGFASPGLWRPLPDSGAAFTLLTTTPGPDVEPIHNRQMIVLEREDWGGWLNLSKPEAALLRPLPAGSLQVEQVR